MFRISDDENESVALHDFIYHTTLPLIGTDQGQTCLIGTGTLFKVAAKHFLITAAHILDDFDPAEWRYPVSPFRGEIKLIGPGAYYRIEGQTDDITVVELQHKETIANLEKEWRFHTLESIWLPDYSADAIVVVGYPSIRAKMAGPDLKGWLFVFKSHLHETIPPEAHNSDDPVTPGTDFFIQHENAINLVTGENVSMETLRGMSGCSIWAYRKVGWVPHRVWAPDNVFRIIGIQSAVLKNNYIRGKAWTAAFKMMANMDEDLKALVFQKVVSIGSKIVESNSVQTPPEPTERPDMTLSERHRELLTELSKKSRVGYGTNNDPALAELIEAGLVKDTPVNLSEILYEITDEGRKALQKG